MLVRMETGEEASARGLDPGWLRSKVITTVHAGDTGKASRMDDWPLIPVVLERKNAGGIQELVSSWLHEAISNPMCGEPHAARIPVAQVEPYADSFRLTNHYAVGHHFRIQVVLKRYRNYLTQSPSNNPHQIWYHPLHYCNSHVVSLR
jgi:hypothetical protein